jgi:hypothetical protein
MSCEHQARSGRSSSCASSCVRWAGGIMSCECQIRSGRSRNSASNYIRVWCVAVWDYVLCGRWAGGIMSCEPQARSGRSSSCASSCVSQAWWDWRWSVQNPRHLTNSWTHKEKLFIGHGVEKSVITYNFIFNNL